MDESDCVELMTVQVPLSFSEIIERDAKASDFSPEDYLVQLAIAGAEHKRLCKDR